MKLTPEQLAQLIAQIFANLIAAGKDPASITTEDIMAELDAVVEQNGEPAAEPEGEPAAEPEGEPDAKADGDGALSVTPELIQQIIDALGAGKSAEPAVEPKAAAEPAAVQQKSGGPAAQPKAAPQRKYAGIFLSTPPVRGGVQQGSDFKTRIASMSERDRRKATFGAFGRAVKCIHASHGDPEQAAFTAERKFRDAEMAREFKALSATSPSDGGYLVPEIYASEIIELLYPATVIYELGARRLGMEIGRAHV